MRWLVALLLCLALPLAAQTYPEYERITVNDYADLLSDAEEEALDTRLTTLRQDTGIELTVLTLAAQADYAPDQSLENFATGVFDHWGVGDASRNDGILIMILPNDRAMRIELGAGFGRDWDRAAADVINRSFLPAFENGNFGQGITAGVEDTITSIAIPFSGGDAAPTSDAPDMTWIVIIGMAGAALIMMRRWIGDRLTRLRRCPNCGRRGLSRARKTLRRATKSNEGEGRVTTQCRFCDYRERHTYPISRVSSSSSSSFGGGRSGGGGASGRW